MIPPFCPNPFCFAHRAEYTSPDGLPFFLERGTYTTKVVGSVQRFRCKLCGRGFSARTFSIDYYTKKTLDNREIFRAIAAGESVSSIARHLNCSFGSAQNRLERLGRNAIFMQSKLMESLAFKEDLVADGFESFTKSQYHPCNINILVGKKSQFLYEATYTTLRRKGRMTEQQKKKRDLIEAKYRPRPAALRKSCWRLFDQINEHWCRENKESMTLSTDEHKVYPIALADVKGLEEDRKQETFIHKQYSSKAERTLHNPLFSVNYYDRELRKDMATFRRESTCFSRNISSGMLRFMSHMVWHNYEKSHRIVSTAKKPPVHAVEAGMEESQIQAAFEALFTERPFMTHTWLSNEAATIWYKEYQTPLKKRPEYLPRYATMGLLHCS